MATHVHPVTGRWYYDTQRGKRLQVTWVDEDETQVEVRFEDGHSEQFPQAAWQDLHLEPQTGEGAHGSDLSDEDFRRATGWAEKHPDDFPDG